MEIETKTASLETFSVTIRALHVNGKQMTLAVFRQLPERPEGKDDQPWGIVRYSIKDAGDVWLVYSSDNRLYRRRVDVRVRNKGWEIAGCESAIQEEKRMREGGRRSHMRSIADLERAAADYQADADKVPFTRIHSTPEECRIMAERYRGHKAKEIREEQEREVAHTNTLAELEAELDDQLRKHKDEKTRAAYDQSLLDTLPQLFIAV